MFSFRPSNWLNFELNFGLLLLLLRLRSSTCPRTHKRTSWAEMTTAATIIYFFHSQPSPLNCLRIAYSVSYSIVVLYRQESPFCPNETCEENLFRYGRGSQHTKLYSPRGSKAYYARSNLAGHCCQILPIAV